MFFQPWSLFQLVLVSCPASSPSCSQRLSSVRITLAPPSQPSQPNRQRVGEPFVWFWLLDWSEIRPSGEIRLQGLLSCVTFVELTPKTSQQIRRIPFDHPELRASDGFGMYRVCHRRTPIPVKAGKEDRTQ